MRLNKFLARCGIGSRRKCDEFIEQKRIKVNGKIIDYFSYIVKSSDYIQYNNKILNLIDEDYIYILNKPRGYVSTSNDPKGRKKVVDLIKTEVRLFNVGRLDFNTTGLILFTNNGDIANKLLHPKNEVIKKYYVESLDKFSDDDLIKIKKGFNINGLGKVSANIKLEQRKSKNSYIWNIELSSGKNRIIRRIFSFYSIQIKKLHRYEFAGIQLNNLKSGEYKRMKLSKFNEIVFNKSIQ
tara:strand:+ start:1798 stop:2514 length:717 start_codon:yes stop_codon:yes gene_type:complete